MVSQHCQSFGYHMIADYISKWELPIPSREFKAVLATRGVTFMSTYVFIRTPPQTPQLGGRARTGPEIILEININCSVFLWRFLQIQNLLRAKRDLMSLDVWHQF